MKYVFYFIVVILSLSPKVKAQLKNSSEYTKSSIEKRIRMLPETKSFFKTAKGSNPVIIVDTEPDELMGGYWHAVVGIQNADQLRPNFDFYVDAKTMKVYYLDTYTYSGTKLITLRQWRKWRKQPAWQKMHTYTKGNFVFDQNL